MLSYIIMMLIALGVFFAGKAVLRSAKQGGCVGCSDSGHCCGGGVDCSCASHKQIKK